MQNRGGWRQLGRKGVATPNGSNCAVEPCGPSCERTDPRLPGSGYAARLVSQHLEGTLIMSIAVAESMSKTVRSPEIQRRINALRTIDNTTNWFYLAREWLVIAAILGLTIAFYVQRESWGLSVLWNIPVTLLSISLIGGCQHRLSTLAHEASHYMLFRHRVLNEVVSDWFCMFPMLSTTHQYRLQHLAHHQFVNDPEKDPDISQMTASGHRFRFPMPKGEFLWKCVIKQFLWIPSLIRYIRVRAKYSATGGGVGPYEQKGKRSKVLILVGILYMMGQAALLTGLTMYGDPVLLAVLPACLWAAMLTFYALVPARLYHSPLVKSDIPPRPMSLIRISHITLVFWSLAWLAYATGLPWGMYYIVLWLVPLVTSFSFFMILRQIVQHGNAGQDRLTNTRIFHVNPLIQLSVFPLGMDYHLPHHMFPMVPHFRLRELHTVLMETQEYRDAATVVEGYFMPRAGMHDHPTVLDLMSRPPV